MKLPVSVILIIQNADLRIMSTDFILSTTDNVPSCRKGLLLLAEQAVGEVAVTNVDYHCADQEYLEQRHLRSLDTEWTADDQVRLFDQDLPNSGEDCQFDDLTGR